MPLKAPRVAIVHEWLVNIAGSERALIDLFEVYPDADLFSVVDFLTDEERRELGGRRATTTFIQRLPWAESKYQTYLPLMPLAIEQLDLRGYDLVISSSHAVAKGVITGTDQLHVAYVYAPMRYAWDMQHEYLSTSGLQRGVRSWMARYFLHRLRAWDVMATHRVDHLIAISDFVARRIQKYYRRTAPVVYPPVAVDDFVPGADRGDTYVTVSRLVRYKRIDLIVAAFAQMPDRRLVVIGDGPERERIRAIATPNVEMLGSVPFEVVLEHLQRSAAFVFAAEEDFGIAPVEAQACGTPVIAYGKGGSLETVSTDPVAPTGVLFGEQSERAIIEAVARFEETRAAFDAGRIRAHALRFSRQAYRGAIGATIDGMWADFHSPRDG